MPRRPAQRGRIAAGLAAELVNWVDYVLIVVIAGSALVGLMRGLLREVMSLVTWIAAIWLAWAFSPAVELYLGGLLSDAQVRVWVARALIFLAVLLVGSAVGMGVTYVMRLSVYGAVDRVLGGLFGVLRAVVLIGLFVLIGQRLQLPAAPWWHGSKLLPYAEQATNALRDLVRGDRISVARMPPTYPGAVSP